MKVMVTGHRIEKLLCYDRNWIEETIYDLVYDLQIQGEMTIGMSGMASGVDIWFCESCARRSIPFHAYIPFHDQADFMPSVWKDRREKILESAAEVIYLRNSVMVEKCDMAVVVWDGNKGGTHNCFQQLLETKKSIHWILPNRKQVISI